MLNGLRASDFGLREGNGARPSEGRASFLRPEALTGNASARLVVEMADLPALAASVGPHIQFHFVAHVEADAKKDLL